MELVKKKLRGSGGYIIANVSDEQQRKGSLGGPDLFLAPLGRIDSDKISKYYCNTCEKHYEGCPKIEFNSPNEEVADNLILVEKGQYICEKCKSIIAEYREFKKNTDTKDVGNAKSLDKSTLYGDALSDNVIDSSSNVKNSNFSFNSIVNMTVYDENAKKIGIAKQVGIDSSQSIVLAIIKNDGNNDTIRWERIKRIGEIILLGTNNEQSKIDNDKKYSKCPNCKFSNIYLSKFCEKCGTKLE